MALSILGHIIAYALCIDRVRFPYRLGSLVPSGIVFLGYAVAYKVLGFGVAHINYYIDPLTEPFHFIQSSVIRLMILWASELSPTFPSLWLQLLSKSYMMFVLLVGFLGLLAIVSWPLFRKDRVVGFALLGMVLGSIPLTSASPGERLMLPLSIGGSLFLACFIQAVWRVRKSDSESKACVSLPGFVPRVWAWFFRGELFSIGPGDRTLPRHRTGEIQRYECRSSQYIGHAWKPFRSRSGDR